MDLFTIPLSNNRPIAILQLIGPILFYSPGSSES